ncbi:hypothetical protein ACTVZO_42825 [Streptomyces sp. IBSNAI002]|uniref:hypothetical protein n=1 Tax=Streptomyces sp. IBSNAI002 TaxID=3457500 RepID=UPI003FD4C00B
MNDQPNRTDADEALERLLHEHAESMRETVGASLHTESGLVSLWTRRFPVPPERCAEPLAPRPERVGPVEDMEPDDRRPHEPAAIVRRQPLDPNLAVRRLVEDLRDEAVMTARITRKVGEVGDRERRTFGRALHSRTLSTLRLYGMDLQNIAEAFEQRAELNRTQVVDLLMSYQQALDSIRHDFHAEAVRHDTEAAGRRERSRYVMWKQLSMDVESRGEALVRMRADITWIFDTSDDLLGMLS